MEPLAQMSQRGPVPIPPQRGNKTVSSGVNPPKSTSSLTPSLNNSTPTNQPNTGNVHIYMLGQYLVWNTRCHLASLIESSFFSDNPAQSLASDFGFEDNFNQALKVEEKKNHQNRLVASREPPPVPPLPPRKASYTPSNPLPPVPVPKERAVSFQTRETSFTSSSKPELVNLPLQNVKFTGNSLKLLNGPTLLFVLQ